MIASDVSKKINPAQQEPSHRDAAPQHALANLLRPQVAGAVLAIGRGLAPLLASFRENTDTLVSVEADEEAAKKNRELYPFIHTHIGSSTGLDQLEELSTQTYQWIICDMPLSASNPGAHEKQVAWILSHLNPDGRMVLVTTCPDRVPLSMRETIQLLKPWMNLLDQFTMSDSNQIAFIGCKKRVLSSITIDYETWHPIPDGKKIDWDADIFQPTTKLLTLFKDCQIRVTFFVEMGEYFWLKENLPALAEKMEDQWREIVANGHDVQLHLHPNWLPELGARCENGSWSWDWSKAKIDDYPGNLLELIASCKHALESAIQPVDPEYRVSCFRAGAYQAQPFERLAKALLENGIHTDSSVYFNGYSEERGYDYRHAFSQHQPYFADLLDPQLKAFPAEERMLEFPVFATDKGERWFIDNQNGSFFGDFLLQFLRNQQKSRSIKRQRAIAKLKKPFLLAYSLAAPWRKTLHRFLPRKLVWMLAHEPKDTCPGHRYFVAIGHTKSDLRYQDLQGEIEKLKTAGIEFTTLAEMADIARQEIARLQRNAHLELEFQVQRELQAILGEQRNLAQSDYLQRMIPHDADLVLDFGCGAGYWSARIAELYPWMKVIGVDAGHEFIEKALRRYASSRVSFLKEDFSKLSLEAESIDCVYADNTLEHSFDVHASLSEIYRVLKEGGVLIAAFPADGLNPSYDCDNHIWKTIPKQARIRLQRAGFSRIEIEQVDIYHQLGMAPFPPSADQMLYVRAWKSTGGDTAQKRALRAMDWIFRKFERRSDPGSEDAFQAFVAAHGSSNPRLEALSQLLRREGFTVQSMTMPAATLADGSEHAATKPRAVLQVKLEDSAILLDPLTNTSYPFTG